MPDRVQPGPIQEDACIREAVCIHTRKIFDSCKEEDGPPYKTYMIIKNKQMPNNGIPWSLTSVYILSFLLITLVFFLFFF